MATRRIAIAVGLVSLLALAGCPRKAAPPAKPPPATGTESAPTPVPGPAIDAPPEGTVSCANCGTYVVKEQAITYFGTVCSKECQEQWDVRRREDWPGCEHCGSKDWRQSGLQVEARPGGVGGLRDILTCGGCGKGSWTPGN